MNEKTTDYLDQVVFDRIKENPVFSALGNRVIRSLVASAQIEKFERGDVLIQQDDYGDFAYLMLEGKISVELELPSGVSEIAIVDAGQIIGEISVFSNTKRSATVRAIGDVKAAKLKRTIIRGFVEELRWSHIVGQFSGLSKVYSVV